VRWQAQTSAEEARRRLPGYRDEAVVRTFDVPEALNTRFYEVHAKSALNRISPPARMPFGWTINPYRGCTHACEYCYARVTHEFLGFGAGKDFEREIVVKVNVPEVLRAELARSTWKGEHVALGTNTDPYQWVEGRYKLMRGIWEALRDRANPCSVLTKSPLLLRDMDLMLQISERARFTAYLSVPTIDERAWRQTEPRTPHPEARLDALRQLSAAGLAVGVVIAPLMPGINDSPEQIDEIVAAAMDAGAESVDALPLHLRGTTKDVFLEWLRAERPELVQRYESLYGSGSEMDGEEQRRLLGLVGPRGRTWETRIRERERERALAADGPAVDPSRQLPLF
jgi:DNA repair photolyase